MTCKYAPRCRVYQDYSSHCPNNAQKCEVAEEYVRTQELNGFERIIFVEKEKRKK